MVVDGDYAYVADDWRGLQIINVRNPQAPYLLGTYNTWDWAYGVAVAGDFAIGHYTHEKSPVGCAAALATIDYIEKHNLVQHARELGRHSLERMQAMKDCHPLIGDVRGLGLFLGIELVKDRQTRERAGDEAEAVMYAALSKGLSFKLTMGNILTLTPALTITKKEMDTALDIIEECIAGIEKKKQRD